MKHWGGEKNFKKTQIRDKEKLEECTENGIPIIYYSNEKIKNEYDNGLLTTTEEVLNKIQNIIKANKGYGNSKKN